MLEVLILLGFGSPKQKNRDPGSGSLFGMKLSLARVVNLLCARRLQGRDGGFNVAGLEHDELAPALGGQTERLSVIAQTVEATQTVATPAEDVARDKRRRALTAAAPAQAQEPACGCSGG